MGLESALPPNTRTTEALCRANRITALQIEAAINAALSGWSRHSFPFNAHYSLDLNLVLTFDPRVCAAMASDAVGEEEKRTALRAAILQATPKRMTS